MKLPPMRQISCSATTQAVIERRKTVTRRWGWEHAKVGDCLRVIDKLRMNLKQPPSVTLACVEIVRVDRRVEPGAGAWDIAWRSLGEHRYADDPYAEKELLREGFRSDDLDIMGLASLLANMAPKDYSGRGLTRIEWIYREDLLEEWRRQHP